MEKKYFYTEKVQVDLPIVSNILCIEGGDFTGKSSLIDDICVEIPSILKIQSPGYTEIGTICRRLVKFRKLPPSIQRMLFNLSDVTFFLEKYSEVQNYIFDRYWLSRLVYQGILSGNDLVTLITEMCLCGIKFPALTIVLVARNEGTLLSRVEGKTLDIIEQELNVIKINNAYLTALSTLTELVESNKLPAELRNSIHVIFIDGKSRKHVFLEAQAIISTFFNLKG